MLAQTRALCWRYSKVRSNNALESDAVQRCALHGAAQRERWASSIMKLLAVATTLLIVSSPAVACKPLPAPPGVTRHWASPEEAQTVVPAIAVGTASYDGDGAPRGRAFRFTVERWVKGTGPEVIYVRGPYYTRQSRLPYHSCMIEFPLNARIVLLLKSVEPDGTAVGVHDFDFLKDKNIFVRPFWEPGKFGL